jgi:two-component sensor histidine kinase
MPIYLPESYTAFDGSLLLAKVNLLVIFYILYAISFFKIEKTSLIFKLGVLFIVVAIIDNFFIMLDYPQLLKISLINVILAIITIYIQSIISYKNGYKQARFFIAGFSVVAIAFILTILDAFGIISFIYEIQNILIIATSIEAVLLSIAFVDSYKLLQESKLNKEQQLLEESKQRVQLINKEVSKKTDQLQHAMVMQDLLFNELHHRVKNNLQLILSITRLQKDQIKDPVFKNQFGSLENRINAIATTHNTIYLSKELEIISMKDYIVKLTDGLKASDIENKIVFNYNIDLNMTLKKAINIGQIINELVSNALKHAFKDKKGEINIILKDGYLEISDNGIGYDISDKNNESLGMKLVDILVKDQLKGTLEIKHQNGTKIIIRFKNE